MWAKQLRSQGLNYWTLELLSGRLNKQSQGTCDKLWCLCEAKLTGCWLYFEVKWVEMLFGAPQLNDFLKQNLNGTLNNEPIRMFGQRHCKDPATPSFNMTVWISRLYSIFSLSIQEHLQWPSTHWDLCALSPLHSRSSASPDATAADGGASRALSGQAAAHSPDTPGITKQTERRHDQDLTQMSKHGEMHFIPRTSRQTWQPCTVSTRLIPHVWLIVKACWRTEDLAVRVHELQLVSSDVHSVYCSLQQVQPLMARSLQAILCRQVGPQGARQACMIT